MRLAGKVAIVTGASRGLGQYVAEGYAREGAAVVVAARTEQVRDERLPGTIYETAARITAAGGRALPVRCNVAEPAEVEALVQRTLAEFGRVDILVNNAAVQPPGGMSTVQLRHWDVEFRVNVHGPFYCTRAVLDPMRAQGSGCIINVSSRAADMVWQGQAGHYGVTKATLEAMTKAFAAELAEAGIAVNALKPEGAVDTPGLRFARIARGAPIPDNLPGPEDFVEAAIILATATPNTFTGQAITDTDAIARFGRGGVIR
jgi:citronellol/citronellal dehydrogenase